MAAPGQRGNRRGVSAKEAIQNLKADSMKFIFRLVFSRYSIHLLIVFICIIISAFCNVRGTLFLQTLIDDYIIPMVSQERPDFAPLAAAMGRIAVVYAVGIITLYGYNRIMVNVGQGSLRMIRSRLFDHMEKLPLSYFDSHQHGDIMSIYTNDTDTLRQFIGHSFPMLVNSMVTIVSVFTSMCILSWPLAILTTAFVAVIMAVTTKLATLSGKYYVQQQSNLGKVNGFIEEMMNGQKVVKVFTREEQTLAEFKELNENLRQSAFNANKIANILMPVSGQLSNLNYVIVSIVGAAFALKGMFGLTIGKLVSFMTLDKTFGRPFSEISTELNSVVMAAAGANRIYALLNEETEVDEGKATLVYASENGDGTLSESTVRTGIWAWKKTDGNGSAELIRLEGDIVFDNVDFSYVPEKQVLFDINMYANKGQKLAFVGSTGAGKTTITNLINRFYDIQDGKIRYDGISINDIRKADLRRSLGIVLQETHLFTGTVMENIRFGKLDATDEEVRAAAKLANADGFIERLPNGYDTMLTGDGANLSQGQRQLLAIARAAVADPPVLILDEATSSIDTRTERMVQAGMDSLMKGRTTFVIAHRLSTVRNADCIMVLDRGRIIERGSHDDLIAQKGRYYELYTGNAVG